MAVQYSSDNGWTTWIDLFKNELPKLSDNANDFFDLINHGMNVDHCDDWDLLIDRYKLADDQLIKFLKDTEYSEKTLANYQTFLEQNGESTSKFSQITAKAGGIVKSFGATLASMAVMWVVGEAINFVASAIDNYIHRFEKAQEAMKNANNAFKESEDKVKTKY